MRRVVISAILAACTAACAASVALPEPEPVTASVFAATRGTALPPPAADTPATAAPAAPPEGVGPGGIDFGRWRNADPASYQPAFRAQLVRRVQPLTTPQVKADLEANGFTCAENSRGLECRIEIMERQCAYDWYVVMESGRAEPAAGFDIMCLGAQ